ncbi:MAG TPA: cupin domain-containing protein [Gammaproteobacteria bacterium]
MRQPIPRPGLAQLFGGLSDETFFADIFERRPWFGKSALPLCASLDDVFGIVHLAHANGDARYTRSRDAGGEIPAREIGERMQGVSDHPAWFRRMFEEEKVAFVIRHCSRYLPALGTPLRVLQERLEGDLYDYCIATPAEAAASDVHYDDLDVFSFNLAGAKRWRLHDPVTPLPTRHLSMQEVEPDVDMSVPRYDVRQVAGDCLYMPRGWVHRVTNDSPAPALQMAVAYTPNTWIGLFSNLLRYAYNRLGETVELRRALELEELESPRGRERLALICREFETYLTEALANGPAASLDFIPHAGGNTSALEAAQRSLQLLKTSEGKEARLVPTGARFLLREHNSTGFLAITTDGQDYSYLPVSFWEALRTKDGQTLEELSAGAGCTQEELLGYLDVITVRLGLYRFSRERA